MVTTVGGILAVISGVVALAALFGVIAARFALSRKETTTQVWKEEAEAYKAKSERTDVALADLTSAFAALTHRVERVEGENVILRELVTGKAEIAALAKAVDHGFADIRSLLTPSAVRSAAA